MTREEISRINDNYNGNEYPELIAAFRSFGGVPQFMGDVDEDADKRIDMIVDVINAGHVANKYFEAMKGEKTTERIIYCLARQEARETVYGFLRRLMGRELNSDEKFFVNLKLDF